MGSDFDQRWLGSEAARTVSPKEPVQRRTPEVYQQLLVLPIEASRQRESGRPGCLRGWVGKIKVVGLLAERKYSEQDY